MIQSNNSIVMMASNMNTTSDSELQATATHQAANNEIGDLYEAIYNCLELLDDSKPLLDTPLHTAALDGKVQLATEIMRVKPSLAWKLNRQGQSPIHLAMQHEKYEMVLRFVKIDEKLVRVKGKEGFTPLHMASKPGKVDLLANFLEACPNSIEDVTDGGETALHIAALHDQFESLKFLVEWLKTNCRRGAAELEKKILNWKDELGNTILHILASKNNPEVIQFVMKTGITDVNAMNVNNETALDLARSNAQDGEIISRILEKGKAKSGKRVMKNEGVTRTSTSTLAFILNIVIGLRRARSNITEEQRNALLVVVTLITTASYQSVLSPPGGVYQANAVDDNSNNANSTTATSLNSTDIATPVIFPGTSIMAIQDFALFFTCNTMTFFLSAVAIFVLTPRVNMLPSLFIDPIGWLLVSYINSLLLISPIRNFDDTSSQITFYMFLVVFLPLLASYLITGFTKFWNGRYMLKRELIPKRIDAGEINI